MDRQVYIWNQDWSEVTGDFPVDLFGYFSLEQFRVEVRQYIMGPFIPDRPVRLEFTLNNGPTVAYENHEETPGAQACFELYLDTRFVHVFPQQLVPPDLLPPVDNDQQEDDAIPPNTPTYDPPPPRRPSPGSPSQGDSGSSSDYSHQGGSGFGSSPTQLNRDVAGLSIDDGWEVFSKKNKNRGETSAPKQWGTRIDEEVLRQTVCDHEIIWPPMVLVRNTLHDKDDNEKWIARGNRKLPEYNTVMARHSYGPRGLLHYFSGYNAVEAWHAFGHKGMSLLIFENSVIGYVEAERLHKHFADQGTGRDAWDHCKLLDGTRHQFYGYMANKEDIDIFNQHCQGGTKVKFEMRSHHEMVVIPMDGDNQHLFWVYSRAVKGEKNAKARQEYYGKAVEILCKTLEENRIVRQRTKLQHEQNKEKVHCELAEILDEELCETVCDHEIVWPPMVVVRYHEKDDNEKYDRDNNEKVDKDDNEKWISRVNRKLPDFDAVMAKHPYGPLGLFHHFPGYNAVQARYGHKGMSLLIFENSAIGYVEAERLHKHFADQGTDRDAWDHCKLLDGTRHQFYGYMANKEDIDIFNQHCQGGTKVKFDLKSHHEMVVIPMDGDNQHLFWLYSRAVKGEKNAKARQEYYGKAVKMLRKTLEENRIVRQRTKLQHEQNKEKMDYQEQFFKDQINHIHQASEEEGAFEEVLQEELNKMQQSIVDSSANEDLRQEEISKFIQTQAKGIEEFEAERKSHPNPERLED